jgi:Tfp pilus assembly PilM family ATPase
MLSLLKKEKKHGSITVDIAPNRVTFAQIQYDNTHTPNGIVSAMRNYNDIKELPKHIADIVNENNFQNFDCNIILHPDYYHLMLVDRPQVLENEYKLALRWQIRGMVNVQAEDMAIDFFKPSVTISEHSKKLYVIVSKISFLQAIVEVFQKVSLNPIVIDIHEFAIRNLFYFVEKNDAPIACLHILENKSIFFIFDNNEIHLARHIEYGSSKFMGEEVSYDAVTEIKHTLDYYLHQLNQSLPDKIVIPNMTDYRPATIEKLIKSLGLSIECLAINELSIFKQVPSEQIKPYSYIALGGELRRESST